MPTRKAPAATRARRSAGLLLWRRDRGSIQVLLGHPGGPFFARKDAGHWTVLKGEIGPGEDAAAVARREFAEETGHQAPDGPLIDLGEIRQAGGKVVVAWAAEGDLDPERAVSNRFEMEWPPRSGRLQEFPEIDKVAWFDVAAARERILPAQAPFLDRLAENLARS
jgi:predicted NUDIX family NTP pyrophosphohydrolase